MIPTLAYSPLLEEALRDSAVQNVPVIEKLFRTTKYGEFKPKLHMTYLALSSFESYFVYEVGLL